MAGYLLVMKTKDKFGVFGEWSDDGYGDQYVSDDPGDIESAAQELWGMRGEGYEDVLFGVAEIDDDGDWDDTVEILPD